MKKGTFGWNCGNPNPVDFCRTILSGKFCLCGDMLDDLTQQDLSMFFFWNGIEGLDAKDKEKS